VFANIGIFGLHDVFDRVRNRVILDASATLALAAAVVHGRFNVSILKGTRREENRLLAEASSYVGIRKMR
jgi:hypothetical protein